MRRPMGDGSHFDEVAGTDGQDSSGAQQEVSAALKQDTMIVFDWDDTILPTSWLLRIHALTADVPMRPEVARQMAALSVVASQTITLAQTMGTVIIITNSAPGWVDQSCQLFMPSLLQQVRKLHIAAKPLNAPLTFKINAFRRECRQHKNVLSIGDGDAERVASLRLQNTSPEGRPKMVVQGVGGDDGQVGSRWIKSVKLIELPTCQQLLSELEMLQGRLKDLTAFQGNLDLKARLGTAPQTSPRSDAPVVVASLVHFGRPPQGAPAARSPLMHGGANTAPTRPPAQPDEGTRASNSMVAGRAGRANTAGTAGTPGQLPQIGRSGAASQEDAWPRSRGGAGAPGGARAPAIRPGVEVVADAAGPQSGGAHEEAVAQGAPADAAVWKVHMKTGGVPKPSNPPPRKRIGGDSNVHNPPAQPLAARGAPMAR